MTSRGHIDRPCAATHPGGRRFHPVLVVFEPLAIIPFVLLVLSVLCVRSFRHQTSSDLWQLFGLHRQITPPTRQKIHPATTTRWGRPMPHPNSLEFQPNYLAFWKKMPPFMPKNSSLPTNAFARPPSSVRLSRPQPTISRNPAHAPPCSAGFQTCCIADFQSADGPNCRQPRFRGAIPAVWGPTRIAAALHSGFDFTKVLRHGVPSSTRLVLSLQFKETYLKVVIEPWVKH